MYETALPPCVRRAASGTSRSGLCYAPTPNKALSSAPPLPPPAELLHKDVSLHVPGANVRVVVEQLGPFEGDVVVSPVKDGRVHNPVRGKSHDGADDGSGQHVIPVVCLVDTQCTGLKHGTEERGKEKG